MAVSVTLFSTIYIFLANKKCSTRLYVAFACMITDHFLKHTMSIIGKIGL